MTKPISKSLWSTFAGALLLFVALLSAQPVIRIARQKVDAERATLTDERKRLAVYNDSARDEKRAGHRAQIQRAWSDARLTALHQSLTPTWQLEPLPGEGSDHRLKLTLIPHELSQWVHWRAAVSRVAAETGLTVESLDIATTGHAAARRFDHVVMVVRLHWATPPTAETSPAATTPPSTVDRHG